MKEKILEVLSKHPNGLRLREIGGKLHVWHPNLVGDIFDLEKSGAITSILHRDMANMDNYIIYKKI